MQFIGGKWVPPVNKQYFDVLTPTTGKVYTRAARGDAADVELALDAAHAAAPAWGKTAPAARAAVLQRIAAVIREHNDVLAYVETVDNGKPIRESVRRTHTESARARAACEQRACARHARTTPAAARALADPRRPARAPHTR